MQGKQVFSIKKQERTCVGCTACCEGWLVGKAYDHEFWPGRKCYFAGQGCCTIYNDRPADPCVSFKCAWLTDDLFPEWLKPSESKVICAWKKIEGHTYLEVSEAGQKIDSEVLSYLFEMCLNNHANVKWQVNGGWYYVGSSEFTAAIDKKM